MIGYVTLEEADLYVATHYVEDSNERIYWEDLDNSDKQVLLLTSFEAIERLPFPGKKTYDAQETVFPRYPATEVPKDIKAAQIENALSQADTDELEDAKQYERLWNAGISSYSIGDLSESIGNASYGISAATQSGITSAKAKKIIIPFLSGGFNI